jgi:hypothetical protein
MVTHDCIQLHASNRYFQVHGRGYPTPQCRVVVFHVGGALSIFTHIILILRLALGLLNLNKN